MEELVSHDYAYNQYLNIDPNPFEDSAIIRRVINPRRTESVRKKTTSLLNVKIYEDIVTLAEVTASGVMVKSDWPTIDSRLNIDSDCIENISLLNLKNVSLMLKVFKKNLISNDYIFELIPIKPLTVDAERVDKIIAELKSEDPWKF